MEHFYFIEQVHRIRHQEMIKQAETYRLIQTLLPRQPKLTDRLLHSLASTLIALGQALYSGAKGSAGVVG